MKQNFIAPIGNIEDITFGSPRDRRYDSRGKPGLRVVNDKKRRPTFKGGPRRGGFDSSGPATTSSAKEAELRKRLGRYGGRRSSHKFSPRVIEGRRIGYGRPRGAPRLPRDDGPKLNLKALAPLRDPRLPKGRSLRGVNALTPLRGPLSIEAPDSRELAPLRSLRNQKELDSFRLKGPAPIRSFRKIDDLRDGRLGPING